MLDSLVIFLSQASISFYQVKAIGCGTDEHGSERTEIMICHNWTDGIAFSAYAKGAL